MSGSTFGAGKKAAIFANVVVMIALAGIASAALIYITGFTSAARRVDLTQAENYTLTRDSIALLSGLERDVEVITVSGPAAASDFDATGVLDRAMEYVRDLLQEYKVRAGGRLSVENLSVHRDGGRVREVQRETSVGFYNYVLLRCGENRRVLRLDPDLAEFVRGDPVTRRPMQLVAYRVEEALSSTIFGIVETQKSKVYVVTGHDELSIGKATFDGGSLVRVSLGQDNIEVAELPLFQLRKIPEDAAAVLVLGPQTDFVDEERAALDAYLRQGGHLLLAVDMFCKSSLDPLVAALGIDLERCLVMYPSDIIGANVTPTQMIIGSSEQGVYGTHPIVDDLRGKGTGMVLDQCAALAPKAGSEAGFTTLIASHRAAFGDLPSQGSATPENRASLFDFRLDARTETQRQRVLAAAIEPKTGAYANARVVIVASWVGFMNQFLGSQIGNDQFLRRSVSWLVGKKKSAIAPPPRLPPPTVTELKPDEKAQIARYTMVVLPGAALALAILIWFLRRN